MNHFRISACALGLALGCAVALPIPAGAACGWEFFRTVNPVPTGNQLTGVAGTAPGDVWEVGATFAQSTSTGYALHWDGKAWWTFPQSDPSKHGGQLSGVAALARDDVWAVGQYYAAPHYSGTQAMVEHWNGSALRVTPVPTVPKALTFLYGVSAIAANDVWAAGGSQTAAGLQRSYIVHWDGTTWSQTASPNVPNMATNLDAIAGSDANDVWSVGGFRASTNAPFRTLAEHWDGTGWSIVPTPNVNGNSNVFNAVVALSRTDAWAVGDYYNGKAFTPLAEHWDGAAWTIVATPRSGSRTAFVLGATAVSPHDAWAVGEVAGEGKRVASLILHWNGRRWNVEPSPNVRGELVTLLNAAAKIPHGSVWAVGGTANAKIVVHTVTEVHRCGEESLLEHR